MASHDVEKFVDGNGDEFKFRDGNAVHDVQIDGTSVVADGTASIPMASSSTKGVVKVDDALSSTSTNPVQNKELTKWLNLIIGEDGYFSGSAANPQLSLIKQRLGALSLRNKNVNIKIYSFDEGDEENATLEWDIDNASTTVKTSYERGESLGTIFESEAGKCVKIVYTGGTSTYFRALAIYMSTKNTSSTVKAFYGHLRIGTTDYPEYSFTTWGSWPTVTYSETSKTQAIVILRPSASDCKCQIMGFRCLNTYSGSDAVLIGCSSSTFKLANARKLKTNLSRTADSTFDGSADQLNIPVTGTLPVGNGGTGKSSVTNGNYLVGNGTSALAEKTPAQVLADIGAQKTLSFDGTYNASTNKVATVSTVTNAVNALDAEITSTDGTNVQAKVTETNGKLTAVNITTDNTANKNDAVYYVEGTTGYADWEPDTAYTVNTDVVYNGKVYYCSVAHTSGDSFDSSKWTAATVPTLDGAVSGVSALYTGMKIAYKWPVTGGTSATILNINNLGGKYIRRNTSNMTTHLPAGSISFLTYDGTYWKWADYDSNTTYGGMVNAYVNNAGDAAKTATCTNFKLTKGVTLWTTFNVANTRASALTLNVNDTGAKSLYINGVASSASNYTIDPGTYPCHYNGTNWYLWTDGTYQVKENVLKLISNGNTITAATGTLTYAKISNLLESGITDIFVDLTFTTGNYLRLFIPLTNCTYPTNGNPFLFSTVYDNTLVEVTLNSNNGVTGNMFHLGNVANDLSGGTDISVTTNPTIGTAVVSVNTTGTANSNYAFVEGDSTNASAPYSHSEGKSTTASKDAAHAEGTQTTASGFNAHAEGQSTTASANNSHSEGYASVASGSGSHAENHSNAFAEHSHSEGYSNETSGAHGIASHTEGSVTTSIGVSAHSEGGGTTAAGKDSHSEGFSSAPAVVTTLSANHTAESNTWTVTDNASSFQNAYLVIPGVGQSTSEVYTVTNVNGTTITTSTAGPAHSSGTKVFAVKVGAIGTASHTEGYNCKATGDYAHAEGDGTVASGAYSHAEGSETVASAQYAHAEGVGTIANSEAMHAAGKYPATASGVARVTGWGTYNSHKDIERLDTDGNLWVSGYVKGATPFYVTPGTTTYAQIEDAWNEHRPIFIDATFLGPSLQNVYVQATYRRVVVDDDISHFEYHFRFEYPYDYRASAYANRPLPGNESDLLVFYYVAVNETDGWLKMVLTDASNLESRTWVTFNTSGYQLAPIPVAYAQKAVSANNAKDYITNGAIDTALRGKMDKDGSNADAGAAIPLLKNLGEGTDDLWNGDRFPAYGHSSQAVNPNDFTLRSTDHLLNFLFRNGLGGYNYADQDESMKTYGHAYGTQVRSGGCYGWKIGETSVPTAGSQAMFKALVVLSDYKAYNWDKASGCHSKNFVGVLDIMHRMDGPSVSDSNDKKQANLYSIEPFTTSNTSGDRGYTIFVKQSAGTHVAEWYLGRNTASVNMNENLTYVKLSILPITEIGWKRFMTTVSNTMVFNAGKDEYWGNRSTVWSSYDQYSGAGDSGTPAYMSADRRMLACNKTRFLNRFEKDDDFTVTMSDISSATAGTVYTYICMNPASYITARWTGPAGQSCSAQVSNGCAASFVLTNTNGRFAKIS